jgi:hypothetical protein
MVRTMRHPLRLLTLALLLAPSIRAQTGAVEIVRVFTGWRDAASFERISEYFDGRESTGGIAMLRSQPGERAGYYWLVRLKNGGAALAGAKFELQVITPASPEPKAFAFPADIPAGSSVCRLGLTGADWPDARARPVAWYLSLLAADGRTVIARQSFLWEMPPK